MNDGTIKREHIINKLGALGYKFNRKGKLMEIYRKKGGTHCVTMPVKMKLSEVFVITMLKQCGCEISEIRRFISDSLA